MPQSFRIFIAVAQGCVLALAYVVIKATDISGGLAYFGLSCLLVWLLHLLVFGVAGLNGLFNKALVFRGILFGISQVLFFTALRYASAGEMIIASVTGGVVGLLLGAFILKEKISNKALASAALIIACPIIETDFLHVGFYAILGGIIQGSGVAITRSIMRKDNSAPSMTVATGLFYAGLINLFVLVFFQGKYQLSSVSPNELLIFCLILLAVQYGQVLVHKVMDTQRSSIYTLSRIPAAIFLEFIILRTVPTWSKIILGAIILGAGVIYSLVSSSQREKVVPVTK